MRWFCRAISTICSVVRVDDDDRARVRFHLRTDVVQVGEPIRLFVADIVARRSAGEAHRRSPQGIVRGGNEDFITVVQQGLHRHHDEFRGAVPDVNVVDLHACDLLLLRVVHHRLARREDSLGFAVTGGRRQVVHHVLDNLLGGLEPEWREVPDVELHDAVPLFFHLPRAVHHGAADVIADVGKLHGLQDRLHLEFPLTLSFIRHRSPTLNWKINAMLLHCQVRVLPVIPGNAVSFSPGNENWSVCTQQE
jgi:hypothetical protein